MRLNMFVGLTIGLTLAVTATLSRGDSEKEGKAERIAALIKQLGDDEFATRENASKELEALGEPALPALRKARLSDDAGENSAAAKGHPSNFSQGCREGGAEEVVGRLLGRRCGGEDDDQGRAIHVEHAYHRPQEWDDQGH